jgi:ABC-type Zn2+ transport system substrate-binding protein/surface adhesin
MTTRTLCTALTLLALAAFADCNRSTPAPATNASDDPAHSDHDHGHDDHAHDDDHDHAHDDHDHGDDDHGDDHGHHGSAIELGTATIGSFSVRAARDEGAIQPGGDAAIDVWLTGDLARITAVRFWIGLEDAAGSVKTKAETENSDQPNHFHTHAEAPSPIPDGSKLWVELDITGEGKKAASFDLKSSPG